MSTLPPWILWLLATLPPLAALWLLWQLLLRPERCLGYNRTLLLAPVLAAALPLLPRPALPLWLAGSPAAPMAPVVGPLQITFAPAGPAAAPAAGWPWLLALYGAGVALALGYLAWQLGGLWWHTRRLPRQPRPGYTLVPTGGRLPTSSFGRLVLWDETDPLTPAEADLVLAHELAHVRQRHTLDVLWLRLWQALLWPNPFVHLLPALRLTHELLADQAAAQAAPATYAPVLARLATRQLTGAAPVALLHPFTLSFTLARLAMLKETTPVRRWKQWLPLPLLAALVLAVGRPAAAQTTPATPTTLEPGSKAWLELINRKRRLAQHQDSLRGPFAPGTIQQFQITNMQGPGEPQVAVVRINRPNPGEDGRVAMQQNPAVYTYVEQMPELPGGGGNRAIAEAIQRNLAYPAGTRKQGKVFAQFVVQPDGSVTDAKIVQGSSDTFDKAVLDAVSQLPRFTPGRQGGKAVAVSFTVPVQFVVKR